MKRIGALFLPLALLCGCNAPAATVTPVPENVAEKPPEQPVPASSVFADWSKLTQYEPPHESYTRYWPEETKKLIPADDYGALLPIAGLQMNLDWFEYRYGLATADGRLVVDPVYDSVLQLSTLNHLTGQPEYLPVYQLQQTAYDSGDEGKQLCGLAALDGSWCTEIIYTACCQTAAGDQYILMTEDQSIWLCDENGVVTPRPMTQNLSSLLPAEWLEMHGWRGEIVCVKAASGKGCWLIDYYNGRQIFLPDVAYCFGWGQGDIWAPATATNGLEGYLDRDGNWAIRPQFFSAEAFAGDYAQAHISGEKRFVMIDRQGNVVLRAQGHMRLCANGGQLRYVDVGGMDKILAVYDEQLRPLEHPSIGCAVSGMWQGLYWLDTAGQAWCEVAGQAYCLPMGMQLRRLDGLLATVEQTGQNTVGVYDLETERWVIPVRDAWDMQSMVDPDTGVNYFVERVYDTNSVVVYAADGRELFRATGISTVRCGLFSITYGEWSGIVNERGEWLMRYHMQTNSD